MDEQVKELDEVSKPVVLPLSLSKKAHENIKRQQKAFRRKTGGNISLKAVSVKLLETASL